MRQTMPGPWKAAVTMLALLSGLWAATARPAVAAAPGGLDPSFGAGGRVVDNYGGSSDSVNALVVQPDGKILAAGQALYDYGNYNGSFAFALSRFNRDGRPDLSFGDRGGIGTFIPGGDAFAQAVALQPNGKIVAAGWSRALLTFALIRKNAIGVLDPSFGNGGILLTQLRGADVANAVAIQPDGKIVVAGWASPSWGADADFALARYNPDGSYDTAFGDQGKVLTDFGGSDDLLNGMALAPDGKIVAVGFTSDKKSWEVARYNSDGSLDPTFGSGGKVTTKFADGAIPVEAYAVAVQPDGRIVLAGRFAEQFALARYLGQ